MLHAHVVVLAVPVGGPAVLTAVDLQLYMVLASSRMYSCSLRDAHRNTSCARWPDGLTAGGWLDWLAGWLAGWRRVT